MPANGRYNRQALNRSRPLLAPIQVAAQKSTITPTRCSEYGTGGEHSEAERTQPEFPSTPLRRSQFHNCPLDKDACPSPFGFEIFKIRIARRTRDSPA